MILTRSSKFVLLGISSTLFAAGIVQIQRFHNGFNNDFLVYYRAAIRLLHQQWGQVYSLSDGAFPFRYMPQTLPFFLPLAWFTEHNARILWCATQVVFFILGWLQLNKALESLHRGRRRVSLWLLLTFVWIARFDSDALYSGQIAGTLFFFFCFALNFFIQGKLIGVGSAVLGATLLKVGPGIGVLPLLFEKRAWNKKFWLTAGVVFALPLLVLVLWIQPFSSFLDLWSSWLAILVNDGSYYDGSNQKSQSLRGLLLRFFGASDSVETLWKVLVLLIVGGLTALWWKHRDSRDSWTRAWCFAWVPWAFVVLMPQSLPYAWVHAAIPLSLLWVSGDAALTRVQAGLRHSALIFFGAVASFPGSDLIGCHWAKEIQAYSLPTFALLYLGIAMLALRKLPGATLIPKVDV